MLEKIFGSSSRLKLLKLFLLNPDKKYYVRQIARELSLQLNSVRRELENLESFGLLNVSYKSDEKDDGKESKTKKNTEKKFYQADQNFVLFKELKNLILKSQILYKKDFVEKIKTTGDLKFLLLTGFFVGLQNAPTDILLVGRINKDKLTKAIKSLEKDLSREINFTIMTKEEFIYRRDVTDVFLYNILEAKKIVVLDKINKNEK